MIVTPPSKQPASSRRPRSRHRGLAWLGALLCGATALGVASPAQAQVDVNPPLPNVMFLVDTSGSMEYLASSSTFPTCNPTGSGSEKSRWTDLVEVMTGSVQNYRCYGQSRSSAAFASEYRLPGMPQIYDYQYTNPHNRILSGTCTPGEPVKTCATSKGWERKRWIFRARATVSLSSSESSSMPRMAMMSCSAL